MAEPIFIKNLLGIDVLIAKKCDKDGNGILECTENCDEISLFNMEKAKFNKNIEVSIFQKGLEAVSDATRVELPPEAKLINAQEKAKREENKTPQILDMKYSEESGVIKNIDYDTEAMKEALDSLLKDNSIMKGTAEAFINYAKKNKLDPVVLMAIAMQESGKGTNKRAIQQKNIGGIMKNGSLRRFNKIEECIDSIANTINRRVTEGYQSIKSIAHSGRYCAKGKPAIEWKTNVTRYAEQIRQKYNELLIEKYGQ